MERTSEEKRTFIIQSYLEGGKAADISAAAGVPRSTCAEIWLKYRMQNGIEVRRNGGNKNKKSEREGAEKVEKTVRFCDNCGAEVLREEAHYCWKCGKDVRDKRVIMLERFEKDVTNMVLSLFNPAARDKAIASINEVVNYVNAHS